VDRRVLAGVAAAALVAAAAKAAAPPVGGEVELSLGRSGFQPDRLVLRRGETVRLVLTSRDGEHCFAIDALRVEKRVVPGRPTTFELTPERAGTFPFYCCLESGPQAERERGELVVSE